MERILPLVAKYDCAVVAISNDDTGISEDPDVRFEVAKRIVNRASDYGIKPEDVVVDPLVHTINNAFLPMLQCAGMTSAIVNVLDDGLVPAVRAADIL